jgi:hypothetical protein
MKIMKVTQIPKREFIPEAEITVSHEGKDITFLAPYFRGSNYSIIRTEIEQAGLRKPTFAETVSLAYDAFVTDRENAYSKQVRELMKSSWLRASNGILYVPNKGAYIQDYPEFKNGQVNMNERDLVKYLESNDRSVRFVPFGYKLEYQTSKELENNPFIRGLAGKEEAEKLAKISDKFKNKPYVWSFDNVNEPQIRFACLDSNWLVVDGLSVDGCDRFGNDGGFAFGVSGSSVSEADARKN